jgi:DMSO/TMAO reductase YedYZ molybdopterin-dependent catalytic subunit
VLDPQEPVPSGGLDQKPHPPGVASTPERPVAAVPVPTETPGPAAAAPAAGAPSPTAAPVATAVPRPSATPARAAIRALARDKDGAVVAAARRPGELAELITPSGTHYVVSKNPVSDPSIRLEDWRLVVDGDVTRSIQLDYASLRNLPAVEVVKTIECISNFVAKCELAPFGCDLISTARWRGARLVDVLNLAGGLKPGVVSLATIGADEYTTALPIEAALDPDTLVVYEMNGEPLPIEHGYPARVLVPGRYGVKNAKWIVALRPMRRDFVDWYGQRNWSKTALVRTMTRIDTPAPFATLPGGDHRVAGIAYAGDRGVAKVEYSADGGKSWQVAELLEKPAGTDSWVRWFGKFAMPTTGALTLVSRATDGTGALQEEAFSLPQPDGGAGWHTVEVRAK